MANAEKVSKQKRIGISSTRPTPNTQFLSFCRRSQQYWQKGALPMASKRCTVSLNNIFEGLKV